MRYYIIQDPYHDYAVRFITLLAQRHNMRPICVYTDPRRRAAFAPLYPILQSSVAELSFEVEAGRMMEFVAEMAQRYDIDGVIPVVEEAVASAATLNLMLGKPVNLPEVTHRFRNKFMLKDFLRRNHPDIRINASRLVHSAADVFDRGLEVPKHFVLKPNSGTASRGIGFFNAQDPRELIDAYFRGQSRSTIVMEEFIGGEEYMVNGQVDGAGNVHVYAVLAYERPPDPRLRGVFYQTRLVHENLPRFKALADYAKRVIKATGLVRSPFHMEVKHDEQGPCLIEVGARLAGHNNAFICNAVHDDKLDVFAVAAHYFLNAEDYGPMGTDWTVYNRHNLLYVHGIAEQEERVYTLSGIEAIEALPSFFCWVIKPRVGGRIRRTTDLLTMPYSLVLRSEQSLEELRVVAAQVRQTLRWNDKLSWGARMAGDYRHIQVRLTDQAKRAKHHTWWPWRRLAGA